MTRFDARREYLRGELDEHTVDADPFKVLRSWIDDAVATPAIDEPYALTIATATTDGRPSARVVLLRGIDDRGLLFFTNYESRKGLEIAANPRAALVFYWGPLERQVRIEGRVETVTPDMSDAYFAGRPHQSRLGAIASAQSTVVESRSELETRLHELEAAYPEGSVVPRPDNWGGFRVLPEQFEFWQGRPGRLHDRIRYRIDDNHWNIQRLAP